MSKTIMITGGSKGLGRALALGFAKQRHRIAVCARGERELKAVQKEIEAIGAEVIALQADVSRIHEIEKFVSVVEDKFGSVDVLINNASVFGPGPKQLLDYDHEQFLQVLKVNCMNPFLVTKRVLPGMIANRSGSIINLTSEAGHTGFAEWGAYGVSKFAVEGLTQTWADEVADYSIRINMVDPGEMDTDMHDRAVPDCDYQLAKPEERLDVFFYLASDESRNRNGERFEADGFLREAPLNE
ncbi:SDR family NAD(P)-dependent oxidoreductase [Halobacillus naozhouensis]|uniref:SDR family NAD(P)-dependent oxidoreductase n=1 Tax=Halobacillus naozhouensis TaxID=554880 RepID=A0ABY8IXR9_9BACI|nr:SDR family oxidoreductase [Halobacillus naozhouensis]WFT74581.1 SDR family NAD(P)-dependent oxidoreductase [Halobacillus naozhouensis]